MRLVQKLNSNRTFEDRPRINIARNCYAHVCQLESAGIGTGRKEPNRPNVSHRIVHSLKVAYNIQPLALLLSIKHFTDTHTAFRTVTRNKLPFRQQSYECRCHVVKCCSVQVLRCKGIVWAKKITLSSPGK